MLVLATVFVDYGQGALEETTLIQSQLTIAQGSNSFIALCPHPSSTSKVYATADHALVELDWTTNSDQATVTVVAGSLSAEGSYHPHYAFFSKI